MLMMLALVAAVSGCSSDASEDLPASISKFVTQYFPGSSVKSYQT